MRQRRYIFIHHNGYPGRTAADIRNTHVNGFGWRDIGYHGVVEPGGLYVKGRPLWRSGAHVKGYNPISWGLCWIGNGNEEGPSPEEWCALKTKVQEWRYLVDREHPIEIANVLGHREVNEITDIAKYHTTKLCPGSLFDMYKFRMELEQMDALVS